jgi:hypothetical protein
MGVTYDQARRAKEHAAEIFDRYASVVSIGITQADDGFALRVGLEAPPSDPHRLPDKVDGVPVQVNVVGTIQLL